MANFGEAKISLLSNPPAVHGGVVNRRDASFLAYKMNEYLIIFIQKIRK